MDPDKIEERITDKTKAILPCHWGGAPADMDRIMKIAKKHGLYVIEDACQAHLGEWRGKKLGTIGDIGCFSHQQSKVLPCGEGGSFVGDNEEIMGRAYAWHDYGRAIKSWNTHKPVAGPVDQHGLNYKMTEFQGAVLLGGMKTLEEQTRLRNENADYLREMLAEIPGVYPQKLYEGTTRASYYLFEMRYDKKYFQPSPEERVREGRERRRDPHQRRRRSAKHAGVREKRSQLAGLPVAVLESQARLVPRDHPLPRRRVSHDRPKPSGSRGPTF